MKQKHYEILGFVTSPKTTYAVAKFLNPEEPKTVLAIQMLRTMEKKCLVWHRTVLRKDGCPKHYWQITGIGLVHLKGKKLEWKGNPRW